MKEMRSGASAVLRGASWLGRGFLAFVGTLLVPGKPHDDRQLHDSDLIGEYNHRTGRLDAGNDPYGWYDED